MARSDPPADITKLTVEQIAATMRPRPQAQFKVTYYDDLTPDQWAENYAEALSMDRYARGIVL